MSTFLKSKNNLYDLEDVAKAREHLGIGTLASQNSNSVFITGGSAALDTLILNTAIPPVAGDIVQAVDTEGNLGYLKFSAQTWANDAQSNVDISIFNNDSDFVASSDLHAVATSGSFDDLEGNPAYSTVESEYLLIASNLSDVANTDQAKSNLGFGPFAFVGNDETVTISNLIVTDNFHFSVPSGADAASYSNKYLKVSQVSGGGTVVETEWVDLPVAGQGNPGLLVVSNNLNDESQFTAPSSKLMYDTFTSLAQRIQTTDNVTFINQLIADNGLIDKNNNLSEFSTQTDKSNVRTNLGLGTMALESTTNVVIDDLTVDGDLIYFNSPFANAYLKSMDTFGNMIWGTLDQASATRKGAVFVQSDHTIEITDPVRAVCTVPNAIALKAMKDDFDTQLTALEARIPTEVSELVGVDNFMLLSEGFRGINVNEARKNLQLSPVAWSGSYLDLLYKPTSLSHFTNSIYLDRRRNLDEIVDKDIARSNLGLGGMALQDSSNVLITGGVVECDTLTVNTLMNVNIPLSFTPTASDPQLYLVASNNLGDVTWRGLTRATEEIYGAVRLLHDINLVSSIEGRVASATAVYRIYTELRVRLESMEKRIDRLLSLT